MRNFLKISDFAKLCGTTKDTLLYYDKHDLLKPGFVSPAGYRYYTKEQYYEFDYISVLKGSGYELALIKKLINKDSSYTEAIDFALTSLRKQKDEIEAKISMLLHLKLVQNDYREKGENRIYFKEYKTLDYGFISLPHNRIIDSKELVNIFSQYRNETTATPPYIYQPMGTIISKSKAYKNFIFYKGAITLAFDDRDKASIKYVKKRRSSGLYAVLFRTDSDEGHKKNILNFALELKSLGYELKSDIFIFYDVSYISNISPTNYVMRYEVKVEKQKII